MANAERVSLLWLSEALKEQYRDVVHISPSAITDLGIDRIVQELSFHYSYSDFIRQQLLQLCADSGTISYRLDIMEDFCSVSGLGDDFEKLLPVLHKLGTYNHSKYMKNAEPLRNIAWQLEILGLYVECVSGLNRILTEYKSEIRSEGLQRLLRFTAQLMEGDSFQALVEELPDFQNKLQSMSSVTIRIDLDYEFKPADAVIVALESKTVKKRPLVSRLLGLKSGEESYEGVSLHQPVRKLSHTPLDAGMSKILVELFNDSIIPIGNALKKYIDLNTRIVADLEAELGFYIGASRLTHRMNAAGLKMCKPETAAPDERICRLEGMADLILSIGLTRQYPGMDLSHSIVANDVEFGPDGRIFLLTGPNQGGKTTYTRAIGVTQLLFQAGIFVPGRSGAISPVDRIFTHFSEEEKPNINNGRLGEESKRISIIFGEATRTSLILLNESLSSTSHADSMHLARDVVKGMRVLGCRAVYATHLLELAAGVERINEEVEGDSKLISMVAGVERLGSGDGRPAAAKGKRTYLVNPGPPSELSFARDIAEMYGISFEQIVSSLKERKAIDP
ncbi:MAG: hypothetical protein K0Q94_2797 [Paenibacillus sp.]|jgi:hypothetical protein|nr:hypothetical protein [Paenibacillus sp.]